MATLTLKEIDQLRGEWSPTSYLAHLSVEAFHDFLAAGRPKIFPPGSAVIEQDDLTSNVYFLLSSYVKVTARLPGGGKTLLALRVGGDVVGELSASDGAPRIATVRACGRRPVFTLELSSSRFAQVLDSHPTAARALTASVATKLRTATRRRIDYTGYPARVRLARLLVELAEDHGYQPDPKSVIIAVDVTQVELGDLVGIAEVTAQRCLRELRVQGLVATDSRRPLIRDLEGLRRVAQLL
jgi:CRP/FNR family transcriptional regulator, cyclic AMP receptor protein